MSYGTYPDIESAVVDTLNASSEIEAIAGADCASTELPPEATLPRIRVSLSGGTAVMSGWLYAPRINIEAWADDKETAFDLLSTASAVLLAELDGALLTQGVVTGFTQETGVSWSPDPTTKTPRYLAGFVAYTHPNP
jgi:hypothetical protein